MYKTALMVISEIKLKIYVLMFAQRNILEIQQVYTVLMNALKDGLLTK